MKTIAIELDHFEFKVLRGKASRQIRTPENLARFLIVRGLGLTVDEQDATNENTDVTTLEGLHVGASAPLQSNAI